MDPWWFFLPLLILRIPKSSPVRHPMANINYPLSLEMSLSIHLQIRAGRTSWFQAAGLVSRTRAQWAAPQCISSQLRELHRRRGVIEMNTQALITSYSLLNQAYHLFPGPLIGFQKIILSVLIGFQTCYLVNLDIFMNILIIVWERTLLLFFIFSVK